MVKLIVKDFLHFLIRPNAEKLHFGENEIVKKIGIIVCSIPLVLFFVLSSFLGLFILTKLGVEMPEINGVGGKMIAKKYGMNTFQMFLAGAIIAPITEEIRFRLSLRYNKLFLSLSVSVFALGYIFTHQFFKGNFDWQYIFTQIMIAIALFLGVYLLLKIKKISKIIEDLYKNYFGIIFYLIVVWFGIIHWNNPNYSVYMFAVTLPQMIVGVFLGYYRLKFGFFYALSLHILWNAMGILI